MGWWEEVVDFFTTCDEEQNRKNYEKLVRNLKNEKSILEPKVTLLKDNVTAIKKDIDSSALKGDAYDFYIEKAYLWVDNIEKQKAAYENFMAEMDVCIANAETKVEYWRNLENIAEGRVS